jgi:hypothetical protein
MAWFVEWAGVLVLAMLCVLVLAVVVVAAGSGACLLGPLALLLLPLCLVLARRPRGGPGRLTRLTKAGHRKFWPASEKVRRAEAVTDIAVFVSTLPKME